MLADRHYMLDAYGCLVEQANSIMTVNDLLVDISNELDMKPIMPPFVIPFYYCEDPEDVGVSAFCFCADGSHITIHTFPYRACYFVDILTNSFFGEAEVTDMICKQIYASNISSTVVDRRLNEKDDEEIDKFNDFGPHYTITVNNIDATLESIYRWLDTIAPKINMQAIARPYVIYDKTENPQYISGALIVAQSHIAFHYSIEERTANIDVFSCSFLESGVVEDIIHQTFGYDIQINLCARGSKHRLECQTRSREARIEKSSAWRNNI
ncbi:MAG: S-adenosylmethionine decarboxylase [Clostridia bacterium]|nr:S-adenosylmethionine decarboxylase [Clostridia bacterium]